MWILLIDDHLMVRRGLMQILSAAFADAEFGEAARASEALELIARQRWDIALVDLNLPDRDGLSLIEELRRLVPSLPLLVVSIYPEEEFAVRCFRLGAAAYLTKDSTPDELAVAVRKALAGGKYVSAAIAERLASVVAGDFAASHDALTNREMQVLRLVAMGHSLKQIAAQLNLSTSTVATYRARIAEKLHVSTNVELARYAVHHGLVP
jgi:DNA-binding NarL/FixJ family response regulator